VPPEVEGRREGLGEREQEGGKGRGEEASDRPTDTMDR